MIKDFTQRQKSEEELNNFFTPEAIQKLFKKMTLIQKQINEMKKN